MTSVTDAIALVGLSDSELIAETRRLAARERDATAQVIAALMELDVRKLYLGEGCSSLFTYCTQVLRFSEHAAYGRIEAARAAGRFPVILEYLAEGSLTLTSVGLLTAHLTTANHAAVLCAARYKSKREVERIIAERYPLPAIASSVRKVPGRTTIEKAFEPVPVALPGDPATAPVVPASSGRAPEARVLSSSAQHAVAPQAAPPKRCVIAPLSRDQYKVQVTISREAHEHLRRAQDLLRHAIPNGDPAAILERALAVLVEDLERRKLAAAKRPRVPVPPGLHSRHVPAAVKRAVWERDEGRCAFTGSTGRCSERGFLELHHVVPFADGGATDAANLQLRCRGHNAYEAEVWFGPLMTRELRVAYV